jgi:uncharacterized protein (DUF885 family)
MLNGNATLHLAEEEYWQQTLREGPGVWMIDGVDRLPDPSIEQAQASAAFAVSLLEKLSGAGKEPLTHEEELSLEMLRWEAQKRVRALDSYWLESPISPYYSTISRVLQMFETHRFRSTADLEHFWHLLVQVPVYFRALHSKLQGQKARGIVLPQPEISVAAGFLRALLTQPEASRFAVSPARLDGIAHAAADDFAAKVVRFVEAEINPVLEGLCRFVTSDYRAGAPASVGVWQYPGGREWYEGAVRANTTLDLSPLQVHQMGLDAVEGIHARLDRVMRQVGFIGDVPAFLHFLKTDRQFRPQSADEIGARMGGYLSFMESKLDTVVGRPAKAPGALRRLAPELEGSLTYGFYTRPAGSDPHGYYNYNGIHLTPRSLLAAEHLVYHELIPGHHFQGSIQFENESLPMFRRVPYEAAYGEGWAEYAVTLAREAGGFTDPYQQCGSLLSEMMYAVRLVVDTGMNYFEWPRERAAQMMRENLLESEEQIASETLRYSSDWPGQALAYQVGSIKMHELRAKARAALGGRFDLRKYNDHIVGSGSMPLLVLERHVDWFIAQEMQRPAVA